MSTDQRSSPLPAGSLDITQPADAHDEPVPTTTASRTAVWRLEYALIVVSVGIMVAFAIAWLLVDIDFERLNNYGYGGLFAISLISAASIIMPMPGAAAVAGAGAVLEPVAGIPTPIMVGLVAGIAETIGELTGYAAGYGGSPLLRDRPMYPRVRAWMHRRGTLTMFFLSSFPNPLVDVAGVAAGAVHMQLRRFLVGVLAGKIVKNTYLAAGGLAGAELLRRMFA